MAEREPISPFWMTYPLAGTHWTFSRTWRCWPTSVTHEATHTPLTLGIFGTWGSGKTSLMTMIRNKVAGGERMAATPFHRTIWFNAWKYNQEEALWRALLLLLLDDLERLLQADPPAGRSGRACPG